LLHQQNFQYHQDKIIIMGFSDNFEIKEGTGWKAAISAAPALLAGYQAINAGIKYGVKKTQVETLLNQRQQLDNPFADVQNPYENLSVATQAAKFQAEQADISLANTLDTLRQTGAAAGGATALAQAALKSKQGISADIEKQEVNNEKLRAQGQLQVDLAKGKGEYMRMMAQEQRDLGDINFAQAQADQLKAQQIASEQSAMSALGSVGEVITKGIVPKKKDGSETEANTRSSAEEKAKSGSYFSNENDMYTPKIQKQGDFPDLAEAPLNQRTLGLEDNKALLSGIANKMNYVDFNKNILDPLAADRNLGIMPDGSLGQGGINPNITAGGVFFPSADKQMLLASLHSKSNL
jgi:hypothetical protein